MRPLFFLFPLLLSLHPAETAPFMERRERARQASNAGEWDAAASDFAALVQENPTDGALWRSYGLALLRSGRFDEATEAYGKALETGMYPASTHYDLACAHALAGRTPRALEELRLAYAAGFADDALLRSDADLTSLHDAPGFRDLVGWPEPGVQEREVRWTRDLDFLARRVREVHWKPFARIPESTFDSRLDSIRASIRSVPDGRLRLEIQRLLAAIGDGHTAVVSDFFLLHHDQEAAGVRFLPLEFFWYDDDVRVVATSPELRALAGARLLALGGVETGELCERLDAFVSRDNEWGARWGIMQALADPKTLAALGLGDLVSGFELRLERLDGSIQTLQLEAGGMESLPTRGLCEALGQVPPLRQQHKEQLLWMHPLDHSLYVRMDAIRDGHEESFERFTHRIFEKAEETSAEVLILDLRDNLGGQGHLALPLLHRLIATERFNRPGGLYVLVGRKTFSAAMALAAQLELHTHARFVGEPTGSRPNFVGETTLVRLPYSGLMLSISSRYHQNGASQDQRFWIAPDLPAPPRFDADRDGRDPALEAVLAAIASRQG